MRRYKRIPVSSHGWEGQESEDLEDVVRIGFFKDSMLLTLRDGSTIHYKISNRHILEEKKERDK